jgi:hypothetical protein
MPVNPSHVFLVSGQSMQMTATGRNRLSPEINQCVVLAPNEQEAYECLAVKNPGFRPLGFSTLQDHLAAVQKLELALQGTNADLALFVSASLPA